MTGLKSQLGPLGVEFLEYELPATGRPIPMDSHPTDLWHWQTTLVVPDAEAGAMTLRGRTTFVSSEVATLPDQTLGFTKALLVRDPDGHVMQIVSQ